MISTVHEACRVSFSCVWYCLTQGGVLEEQSGDLWGRGVRFV